MHVSTTSLIWQKQPRLSAYKVNVLLLSLAHTLLNDNATANHIVW